MLNYRRPVFGYETPQLLGKADCASAWHIIYTHTPPCRHINTHAYVIIYVQYILMIIVIIIMNIHIQINVYIYVLIIEGSLEVKLPTIWTVEKQR